MADERLEEALANTGAKVLILDPIQAYLGGGMYMNRANEARDMTKKPGALAKKYQCAILLIGHMNKASGNIAAYRVMGSIDFFAVARSVLLVGRIKREPNTRAVVQIKNNLAAIYQREQQLDCVEKKLAGAKGIFKGKRRKELQEQTEQLRTQITGMKQYLSIIVQGYGYKNVKEFLAEYKDSKAE